MRTIQQTASYYLGNPTYRLKSEAVGRVSSRSGPDLGLRTCRCLGAGVLGYRCHPGRFLGRRGLYTRVNGVDHAPVQSTLNHLRRRKLVAVLPGGNLVISNVARRSMRDVFRVHLLIRPCTLHACNGLVPQRRLRTCARLVRRPRQVSSFYGSSSSFRRLLVDALPGGCLHSNCSHVANLGAHFHVVANGIDVVGRSRAYRRRLRVLGTTLDSG